MVNQYVLLVLDSSTAESQIPFWLWKLHGELNVLHALCSTREARETLSQGQRLMTGLGVEFRCEICSDAAYQGRKISIVFSLPFSSSLHPVVP